MKKAAGTATETAITKAMADDIPSTVAREIAHHFHTSLDASVSDAVTVACKKESKAITDDLTTTIKNTLTTELDTRAGQAVSVAVKPAVKNYIRNNMPTADLTSKISQHVTKETERLSAEVTAVLKKIAEQTTKSTESDERLVKQRKSFSEELQKQLDAARSNIQQHTDEACTKITLARIDFEDHVVPALGAADGTPTTAAPDDQKFSHQDVRRHNREPDDSAGMKKQSSLSTLGSEYDDSDSGNGARAYARVRRHRLPESFLTESQLAEEEDASYYRQKHHKEEHARRYGEDAVSPSQERPDRHASRWHSHQHSGRTGRPGSGRDNHQPPQRSTLFPNGNAAPLDQHDLHPPPPLQCCTRAQYPILIRKNREGGRKRLQADACKLLLINTMERRRGGLIGMDAATELFLPWFGHAIVSEGRRRRRGHSAQTNVCTVFYYPIKSLEFFSE